MRRFAAVAWRFGALLFIENQAVHRIVSM